MITTPSGPMVPIVYKDGLLHIKHFYPTNKQMVEIVHEEIMTSAAVWNPTLLDNSVGATILRIIQSPTTPIEFTDDFYNLQGDIIVQKSDIDIDSVDSRNSTNSKPYCSRTRKEKQKICHEPKGKRVKLLDLPNSPSAPTSSPPSRKIGPAPNFES